MKQPCGLEGKVDSIESDHDAALGAVLRAKQVSRSWSLEGETGIEQGGLPIFHF